MASINKKFSLLSLILSSLLIWGDVPTLFYIVYFSIIIMHYFFYNYTFYKILKSLLTLLVIPFSIYLAGSFRSVEFACMLLAFLSILKYQEVKKLNDYQNFIIIYILYFGSIVMLASQVIIYFLSLLCLIPHFVYLSKAQGVKFENIDVKVFLRLFSISLVAIVFFYLIIPQIGVGGFGKVNRFNETVSGISNELSPGSLFEISKDTSIHLALDVSYLNSSLKSSYWRIYTFEESDGKNWTKSTNVKMALDENLTSSIIVNDLTKSSHPKIKNNFYSSKKEQNSFLQSLRKIRNYTLYPSYRVGNTSESELERNLITKNISKEFLKYFENIQSGTNSEKFTKVINQMSKLGLSYATAKTVIETQDMSSFLFSVKRGYCEHFASATALALRVVGVPARVIVGYFGGKYNDRTKMIFLTGENSHAWVEYYNGKSWVEVDPVELLVSSIYLPDNDFVLFSQVNQDSSFDFSRAFNDIYIAYMTLNFNFFKYDLEFQKEFAASIFDYIKNNLWILVKRILLLVGIFKLLFLLFQTDKNFYSKVRSFLHIDHEIRVEDILLLNHRFANLYYQNYIQKRYGLVKQMKRVILLNLINQYYKIILNSFIILESVKKSIRRFR